MKSTTSEMYVDAYEESESKLFSPVPNGADSTQVNNIFSSSTGPLPAREDYPGPYDFSVLLDGVTSTKNKWTYSVALNKLYIVWDKVIPMQFKWIAHESNLVVRALPVYTDAQDMKTPVERCLIHSNKSDATNEGFDDVKHVIRSDNPGAIYDYNAESERTSVVVPLGELQPGTGTVTVTYKFMCKTSCSTGMMRRPITVLFTLERATGEVIGRQKLNVKICCCPKRDRSKDEEALLVKQEDEYVKRPLSPMEKAMSHKTKRMKTEMDSTELYKFNIVLPDHSMFRTLTRFLHGAVSSLLRQTQRTHPQYNDLNELLHVIERKLNVLNSVSTTSTS